MEIRSFYHFLAVAEEEASSLRLTYAIAVTSRRGRGRNRFDLSASAQPSITNTTQKKYVINLSHTIISKATSYIFCHCRVNTRNKRTPDLSKNKGGRNGTTKSGKLPELHEFKFASLRIVFSHHFTLSPETKTAYLRVFTTTIIHAHC